MEFQLLKGFHDILPDEAVYWQDVESTARAVLEANGFGEVRLPILEVTTLFKRSIGEETDIVSKEMYSFKDQKGRDLSLRPEATAQVVRAYMQNRLDLKAPVIKLYTIGPMFRHERPQKGRFRQFHQIDVEVIGDKGPISDGEVINLAWALLNTIGLKGLQLFINTLGCKDCRPNFKTALASYLKGRKAELCPDCKRRSETNPLRVFDCKSEGCNEAMKDAPIISGFLCQDCKDHFRALEELLKTSGVPYTEDPMLVRGLDYYTRTTFEVKSAALGAQNAVAGGGRYDHLVSYLGGPDKPAIGFAIGMERAIEILREEKRPIRGGPDLFLAALGREARYMAFGWVLRLREAGIRTEMSYQEASLKSQMRQADRLGARYVLIVGGDEILQARAVLKDMSDASQRDLPMDTLVDSILKIIKGKD